jgi:hypothetical protein
MQLNGLDQLRKHVPELRDIGKFWRFLILGK